MNCFIRSSLYFCLLATSINIYCVTCYFYNKTPFEIIVSLDIPLSPDKELKIPAGTQETYSTGLYPVRSYVVHALINKLNEKKQKKVQIFESNQMKFRSLKCSLFIEPLTIRDANQQNKKRLRLDAVKFWVVPEHPEHGEEAEL